MTDARRDMEGRRDTSGKIEDDEALALKASWDRTAFAELYHRHANGVYRYILGRVSNIQDAQDLTSQTFLAALDGIMTFRAQGSFAAWLFGIAQRKVVDHLRRSRKTVSLDVALEIPSSDRSTDEIVGRKLNLEQIGVALRSLPVDRAEALALRVFAGLSAREAGYVLGRSEAAVRMLAYRAVQDLRKQLCIELEDEQ
jgi:RNA polymerase sigma-70 factor (ECF subfamily)